MLSADGLLALLQWALIGVGSSIFVATIASLFLPVEVSTFTYVYPNGQTVQAESDREASGGVRLLASLVGLAVGLTVIFMGALLFCLRRIARFMGDLRDEMRVLNEESG